MINKTKAIKNKGFKGKVIWIVGCSSGIGKELAKELLLQGACVVLSSHNKEKMSELFQYGKQIMLAPLDLIGILDSSLNEIKNEVISRYGRLDYLFLNAGISHDYPSFETTNCAVDRVIFETNFFGLVKVAKCVSMLFISQGCGSMVVTSSVMGKFGYPNRSFYSASKHALHGFFDSLRLELMLHKCDSVITMAVLGSIDTDIGYSALNVEGKKLNRKGEFQKGELSPEVCAKRILHAVICRKWEVFIGTNEIYFTHLRKFCGKIFYKILYRHCVKNKTKGSIHVK